MKKRLFLLILLSFLLCGCTANVNITINDNIVSERVSIVEAPYGDASISDIASQYRKYVPAFKDTIIVDTMPDAKEDGVKYYRQSGTEVNGSYNAYYQYDYNFREFKNSTSINSAFKSSTVQYDSYEKTILFSTESSGMVLFDSYPQLDEVKINITTNYKVLENNADYNSGNVYTWVFNKNTKKGVYLLLEDKEGKSVKTDNQESDNKGDKETSKNEEKKDNDDQDKAEEQSSDGQQKDNDTSKEEKSKVEKVVEDVREKEAKHPYVVAIVAIVLFLFIVFASFRIKKV